MNHLSRCTLHSVALNELNRILEQMNLLKGIFKKRLNAFLAVFVLFVSSIYFILFYSLKISKYKYEVYFLQFITTQKV